VKEVTRERWPATSCSPNSERLLWCAVLTETLDCAQWPISRRMMRNTAADRLVINEIKECRNWFSLSNRNFREVCELAGFEPHYVLRLAKPLIAEAISNDKPGEGRNFPASLGDRPGSIAQECA
jgi:hypothetical protein